MAATEAQECDVSGVVTEVTPNLPVNGKWPKERFFKIRTLKSGTLFNVTASCFCDVKVEDAIWATGTFTKEGNKYFLTITKTPIIEPSITRGTLVGCVKEALTIRKNGKNDHSEMILNISLAGELVSAIAKLKPADSPFSDMAFVNLYLVKKCNLYNKAKDEAGDTIYSEMLNIVTEKQAATILRYWYHKRERRQLMMIIGLSSSKDKKDNLDNIIMKSKLDTDVLYQKIRNNPYTVHSLSKDKCDSLALTFGLEVTADQKIRGEILRYVYYFIEEKNWTCVPIRFVLKKYPDAEKHLPALTAEVDPEAQTPGGYGLILDTVNNEKFIYARETLKAETVATNFLLRMSQLDRSELGSTLEPEFKMSTLTKEQKVAVAGCINDSCTIITGGGGTGKTTIVTEAVHNLILRGERWLISAPTGKAVSRVKQAMKLNGVRYGDNIMTMHRAIYKQPESPETIRYIFIDEASMITLETFTEFLSVFPRIRSIIFIGDCNQLSPIGWGSVFSEMINSGCFPIYRLSKNHRCYEIDGEFDGVSYNSNIIANHPGGNIPFTFRQEDNFKLIEGGVDAVKCIIEAFKQKGIPDHKICIVTPRNVDRGKISSHFQNVYLKDAPEMIDDGGSCWKIGDKVMMLENVYGDIEVMNGEIGRIISFNESRGNIRVCFNDKWVDSQTNDVIEMNIRAFDFSLKASNDKYYEKMKQKTNLCTAQLSLAYCLTVHKSQGSESEYLIMYIPENLRNIDRNLMYTGITRGRRCVYLVGDLELARVSATRKSSFRFENLARRIKAVMVKTDKGIDQREFRIEGNKEESELLKYFEDEAPDFDDFD